MAYKIFFLLAELQYREEFQYKSIYEEDDESKYEYDNEFSIRYDSLHKHLPRNKLCFELETEHTAAPEPELNPRQSHTVAPKVEFFADVPSVDVCTFSCQEK